MPDEIGNARKSVLSNLDAAAQAGMVVIGKPTGDTADAQFAGLTLGAAAEDDFVTANTSLNTGATWQDLGNEIALHGAQEVTIALDVTMGGLTGLTLRGYLRRTPAGIDFIEQWYTINDMQTLNNREHALNPDVSGRCYAVLNSHGFKFLQVQVQPAWTGGTSGQVNSTSFALLN